MKVGQPNTRGQVLAGIGTFIVLVGVVYAVAWIAVLAIVRPPLLPALVGLLISVVAVSVAF